MSTSISISTSAAAAHAHTHARVHYGVSPASCVAMVHVRDSHSSYVAFASVDAVQLFRIGPAFDHVQSLRPPPSFASFDSAAPSLHVSALAGHASNGNIAVALSDGRLLVYSPEYSLPIGAGIGGAMGVSSWALSYQSTLARPATSLAWAKETLLVADTHSIAAYSSTTNWSQTWAIKCAPDAPIIVLAPSPDNHCLASMSMDDCLVKVWVSSTGGPITSAPPRAHSFFYLPHPQPVTSVSWRRTKSQRVLLANCTDGVARVWKWSPKLKLFLLTVAIDPQTVLEDVGLAPSSCFWLGAEAIAPHPQPSVYLSNSASEKMVRTDPELAELVKEYDELVMSGESNGTVLVWGIRNLSRQTGDTSAALVKVVPNCFRPEHFATLACPHTVQFAFNTSLEHLLLLGASAQGTLSCLSVNIGHLVYRPHTKMRLVRQWSGHTLTGPRPTAYGVGKWLVTQVGPELLVWDPANRHSGLRQVNGLRLKSRCMLPGGDGGGEQQDKSGRVWYLPLDGKTDSVIVTRSQIQCASAKFRFEKEHGVPLDACIMPTGPGPESQHRLSVVCTAGLVILSLPTLEPIPIQTGIPSTIDHAAIFLASDRYHAVLLSGTTLQLVDSAGSIIYRDPIFSPPATILQILAANHTLVIRTADAVHVYTIGLVHHAVTLERTLPLRATHAAIFPLPTGGVVLAIGRDHHVQVFARRVGLASPSSVLDPLASAKDEPMTPSQPTGLLPTLPTTGLMASTAAATAAAKPEPIPVMDLSALEWYTLTSDALPGFVDAVAWTSQGDLVAMVAHTLVVLDPIPTLVQEALDAQSPALDSGSVLREWLRWNRPEVVRAILNHVYYARRTGVDRTPIVPWDVVEEAAGIKGMQSASAEVGGSGDGLSLTTKAAGDELDALFAAGAGAEVLDMDLIDTKRFNQEKAKALREILEQSLASAATAAAATAATATTSTDSSPSTTTTARPVALQTPMSAAVIRDTQLLAVLDAISEPESASMDENGQRFRWDVLLYMHSTKRNLPTQPLSPEAQAFAFFSDDQPALVDYILNACTITWETATALGAGWWLTHPDALRTMAEAIARNHWRKANNPHDCFLYYLALGKRKLMLTLWKQANGHAEQQVMMQFLAKDVNDAWKKQALKNAFVLLGKQRFELAACFFLLGEAYGDAITVCIRNLKDPQLALFVAKLVGQPGVGTVVDQIRASGNGVIESHACYGMMADWMAGSRMVDMAKVASPATYLLVQSMERKLQVQYLASAGITPQERRVAVGRAIAWYHERGAPYFTRLMMATLPVANGVAGEAVQPEEDEFAAMFGGGSLSDGPPKVSDAGGADDFEAMFGASISDGPPKRSNGGGDEFDALFGSSDPKPATDSSAGGDAFDALFGESNTSKPIDDASAIPAISTSAMTPVPVELLTTDEKSMIVQADHLATLWQVAKSIFVVQSTPLAHDLQFDDYAKLILRQIHSGPDSPAHIDSLLDLLCWLTLSPNSAFYVCKQLNVDLFLSLNLRILVHMLGRTGPEDLDENQRSMFLVLLLHCLHTLGDSALLDPTAPASAAPHSAIVTTLFLLVHVLASRGLYRALGALVRHLPAVITPASPALALSSPASSPLVSLRTMHSEMQPHLSDLASSRHLVLEYLTLRMFQDWMYAVIVEFQQGMSPDEVFVVSDVCVPHLTARLRWIHDEVHRTETLVQSPAEDWLPSAHQELFEALKWSTVWLDELRVPRIALKELPIAGPGTALATVSAAASAGTATTDAALAAKPMPLEEGFLRLSAFNTAQAAETAARASADPNANPTGLRTIVTPADPPFVPKIDTVFKHDAIINGMSLHPSCANLIVAQAKAVIELNVERAHRTMQRVLSGGPGSQPQSQQLPPGLAASNAAPPPLVPNLSSTSLSAMGAHTAVLHDPYAGSPPAVLTRTSSTAATDDPTTLISPALSNRSAATTASTISGIGADFMKKARQAVDSTLGTGATLPASGIANEFGIVDFLPTSHAQVASHSALDYYVLADWIDNNTILSLRQFGGRGDLLRIPYGAAKVNKLEIDSVGGRLAVADTVGDVAIFGLPSMRIFSSFPCHSRFTSDVVFHGSSTLLVSAGSSPGHINNVALWDTLLPVHSARVRGYNIHESGATAVAYDGRLVYSGGKKGDMHVLDTRHSRPLLSLQAHGSTIASLAVSPNSSLLYSGSIDGTLKVWDMSTSSPTEITTFKHMHGTRKFLSVSAAATLPVSSVGITKILAGDGFVLTCGADGAVKWLH